MNPAALAAIQAGLEDKSFQNSYDAKQKAQQGQLERDAALKQLLMGKQADATNKAGEIKAQHSADLDSQEQAIQRAQAARDDLAKGNPGHKYNVGVTKEGASISEADALPRDPTPARRAQETNERKYSEGLTKYADLQAAAQDLERLTDRDGKGGIFTNPSAKLASGGKINSALPDWAIGAGEMVGAEPQGAAEERKAIARYKLATGHALTGARMNPAMQKAIGDAQGAIASGDPALMAKGIRGAARLNGQTLNTVQSGYDDATRETVHNRLGGDPMDFYRSIPAEGAAGAPPPAQAQAPQSAAAPQPSNPLQVLGIGAKQPAAPQASADPTAAKQARLMELQRKAQGL